MIIQESGPQINEAAISAIEQMLKIKLPQDYKDFLMRNNGGRPTNGWVFHFYDAHHKKADSSVINDFYILHEEETAKYDDIRYVYKSLLHSGQIPQGLLPIADDPGGNIIFVCASEIDCDCGYVHGRVFFGNHEQQDPVTGYIALSPVADSFADFLHRLQAA